MDLSADGTAGSVASATTAASEIPSVAPLEPDATTMLAMASTSSTAGALAASTSSSSPVALEGVADGMASADVVAIDEDDEGVDANASAVATHVDNVNVPPLARADIEDVVSGLLCFVCSRVSYVRVFGGSRRMVCL